VKNKKIQLVFSKSFDIHFGEEGVLRERKNATCEE
jgi:hypothetical protein